jgi:selenocysteine-specific elongation factor
LRIARGVYLRPQAVPEAVRLLRALPQPFTMSAAREALGTTRRVAVPLLELLDLRKLTERVDSQRRIFVDPMPSPKDSPTDLGTANG